VTLNHSLISDEAGRGAGASFTGAFVGMCCQDLSGQNCPADFDYFQYTEEKFDADIRVVNHPLHGRSDRK